VVLHGLGHGGALIALAWIAARPGTDTRAWTAARTWALPGLDAGHAALLAGAFWVLSLVAFVIAGAGLAGFAGLADAWRWVAVAGAIVSLAGIALFAGTWPVFNTLAAIAVNVGILALVLGGR
jgi:hypothetical protein